MRFVPNFGLCAALFLFSSEGKSAGAESVPIANPSFELPATDFVDLQLQSWQKLPKPDWFVESPEQMWDQLVGVFKDAPDDPLLNIDQQQAIYIFVVPQAGFFQDLTSDAGTTGEKAPLTYLPGASYQLNFALVGGRGNMAEGVALTAMLYYRDATGNFVPVGQTAVTNSPTLFPNISTLLDFEVNTPPVQATDPWAGQQIGVLFISTPNPELQLGGYWDLDNVRLSLSPGGPSLSFAREGTDLRVSWPSAAGKLYQLESSVDLQNWSPVASPLSGDGSELSELFSLTGADHLFVRLRESQVP